MGMGGYSPEPVLKYTSGRKKTGHIVRLKRMLGWGGYLMNINSVRP